MDLAALSTLSLKDEPKQAVSVRLPASIIEQLNAISTANRVRLSTLILAIMADALANCNSSKEDDNV